MFTHLPKDSNVAPLIDFIRYTVATHGRVSEQRRGGTRLPKRIYGSRRMAASTRTTQRRESSGSETPVKPDRSVAASSQQDWLTERVIATPELSLDLPMQIRKRSRSPSESSGTDLPLDEAVDFERVSEARKHQYLVDYIEVPFSNFGLSLLHSHAVKSKSLFGAQCCYLKLGTSTIVSGRVADVDFTKSSRKLCIAPDRGEDAPVCWVDADRVYEIPDTPAELRKLRRNVVREMKKAIDRME